MTYEKCIEVHWRMFFSFKLKSLSPWFLTLREMSYPLACKRCYAKMCWSASQEVSYFNSASVAYGLLSLSARSARNILSLACTGWCTKKCIEICCTMFGSSMKLQWFLACMLLSPLQICWGTTNANLLGYRQRTKVRRWWKLAKRE
jgi:hypothetical protein